MNRLRMSLTAKIFSAIAATAVLVVAIMAALVALSMREGFSQYLLKAELARFDDLAQALVLAHDPDAPGWPELAAGPQAWNDFVRANSTAIGPDTRPPRNPPPGPLPPDLPPPDHIAPDPMMPANRLVLLDAAGQRLAGATERSALFESRPVCAADGCDDAGTLGYIGLNAPVLAESSIDTFFLRGQYTSLALSAVIAVMISAVAAFLVARQLLIPIKRLEVGAKTLASGNYAARITQDRTDELGRLIGHYNTLAATLEQTKQAEREWISNTSHELQTPLSVLRAQIEALQDGIRQPDGKTLAEMHAALMRLSRLVQDLKALSHAREAELGKTLHDEDLTAIAREAAESARAALTAKGLELECDFAGTAFVRCDRMRIGQVIDNLLQNAGRYTDAPGRVRMQVRRTGGVVQLIVEDTPPAVHDAAFPRLFDRFYRVESSRSRAHGGSGLGLSVCKAIVEEHGGTIVAERSDMGGLRIVVSLPETQR